MVFPPTSRNTSAEGVSHCEAYVSCRIRSLANSLYEEPFCDDGGCNCSCVLARRRKCRVNHVELVRAYMRKHCFDSKHVYSVPRCHPRRPEVAVAGTGFACEECNCSMTNCSMTYGLYDQTSTIHIFGYGTAASQRIRTEPRETVISPPVIQPTYSDVLILNRPCS